MVILSWVTFEAKIVVEGKRGLQVATADLREDRTLGGRSSAAVRLRVSGVQHRLA